MVEIGQTIQEWTKYNLWKTALNTLSQMIPNVIIDAVLVLLQEKIFCSLAPFEFLLDILGDMI